MKVSTLSLSVVAALNCAALSFSGFSQAEQSDATEMSWQQPSAGVSQMTRGGVGLIQTPTARMAPVGDLSINYTDNQEYRFWSVSLQLLDWMESTVRYTDVRTRLYSQDPGFSGDQTLKDKGIDVKFRLWQESTYLPQISLGFNDFGGTGFFNSEFLAFSKKWHNVDFHLGIGWGYLGSAGNSTNPFCSMSDRFCHRQGGYSGVGGKIDYQRFFRGPASIFGGIEYQTPWQPLRLKLEYEGNDYSQDKVGKKIVQDSRWNFGAVYQWKDFNFDLNYQRGNTFGFGAHYTFNMQNARQIKIKPAMRPIAQPLPELTEITDRRAINEGLIADAGFLLKTSRMTDDEFIIYGESLYYRDDKEATERIGRVLVGLIPSHIKRIRIVEYSANLPMLEKVIDVDNFIAQARYDVLQPDIRSTYVRQSPDKAVIDMIDEPDLSGLYTNLEAFWIQTFGSPEEFYMYQGGVFLSAGYMLGNNISVNGTAKVTLLENFDKFNFKVDSQNTGVPRVRTYVREYVTRSHVTMENLFLHWHDKLSDNVFGQVYAGYLETMYGGVGGELLYRPVDSSLAIGVDLNYVRQRSYENDFSFFDYNAFTGFVNLYWTPEFLPNTRFTMSVGQYLAKDKGVTIEAAKRFDSGIIVGAYAAKTDLSAAQYGEGSFTKGFYVSIPFDLFSVRPAKGRGRLPWIPISRDGGQMLNRPVNLINSTESRSPFFD